VTSPRRPRVSNYFRPAQCQQGNPPSQRAPPEAKSEIMLEATNFSLVGLCFCLLAISAAAPPSTIFCCTFLSCLLFGCPLFARYLIPSQAKPVAVKRHRKPVRLKKDAVMNDSIGASIQVGMPLLFRQRFGTMVAVGPPLWQRLLPCQWRES
jgi:hypothetical protein